MCIKVIQEINMPFQYYNILSLNVNGLNSPIKRSKMVSKLKKEKGIGFWQETHLSNLEHQKLKNLGFCNTFFSSHKSGNKRGVAILIPNSLSFELVSEIKDKEGRYILVKGRLEHKDVTLLNVYAPPGSKRPFFKEIFNLIALEVNGTFLCAGDFNFLLNPKLDTNSKSRKICPIETQVNNMLSDMSLIDVWRDVNGPVVDFTFYSARHNIHSRIDYFFMFNRDVHRVGQCRIGQRDLSDHSSLHLTLHLECPPQNTLCGE